MAVVPVLHQQLDGTDWARASVDLLAIGGGAATRVGVGDHDITGVADGRTKAADTTDQEIKRTGRGYATQPTTALLSSWADARTEG